MKYIKPTTLTDAMLISSTRAENDYAAWSSGTTYAAGGKCISATTHRIYESVQSANTNHDPTTDNGTWWLDIGPTNRWAMFDAGIGSITSQATPLTVVIAPGIVGGLALLDLSGTSVTVSMTDGAGGPTVYSETISLADDAVLVDWYGYFFDPIEPKTTVILTDLPPYGSGRITVSIAATTTAQCGTLAVGSVIDIGETLANPTIGIIDYSRRETDAYGVTTVVERAYSKRIEANFWLPSNAADYVTRKLAEVRATPVVWIVDDRAEYESLIAYGFYRDWGVNIVYPNYSDATITIEGLV